MWHSTACKASLILIPTVTLWSRKNHYPHFTDRETSLKQHYWEFQKVDTDEILLKWYQVMREHHLDIIWMPTCLEPNVWWVLQLGWRWHSLGLASMCLQAVFRAPRSPGHRLMPHVCLDTRACTSARGTHSWLAPIRTHLPCGGSAGISKHLSQTSSSLYLLGTWASVWRKVTVVPSLGRMPQDKSQSENWREFSRPEERHESLR